MELYLFSINRFDKVRNFLTNENLKINAHVLYHAKIGDGLKYILFLIRLVILYCNRYYPNKHEVL